MLKTITSMACSVMGTMVSYKGLKCFFNREAPIRSFLGDSIKLTCPGCTKEMDFPKDPLNEMDFPNHYQKCVKLKYHNLAVSCKEIV